MTYFVRGLDRPILRQTQLETYERKVKFKRIAWRPLIAHDAGRYNDCKMHSMALALGRAEHAKSRATGLCNHQNNLKFHHNTFKSTFQSLTDVQIQFRDKFSLSTFQGEFKFHSFKAMHGNLFVYFL